MLECSACGGKLTGSQSRSRNGTRHAYYHCNHCKVERYRAENANETMIEVLNDLRLGNDNTIIHRELVKRMLNGGESDRKGRITKLQNLINQHNERIERLEDNLADGAISPEDFVKMKTRFSNSKNQAEQELIDLKVDNTEKSELLKRALEVISGLREFYSDADANSKIKLLGSIFPEMIEFDGKKCRTTKINEAISLCLSIDKGFSKKENRILPEKLEVSGWVEPTGQMSNQLNAFYLIANQISIS
jgi:site-specific DNA recombinase